MRTILLDKIGSVTMNCRLSREVRVSDDIPAVEGGVIAVRVLNSKSTYNQIELPSGRFCKVIPGDILAVALGHRKALFGYSGYLPKEVKVGDKLNLLNLGGVLGVCDSINPDLGEPYICEVLGQILTFPYLGERIGIPAHISQNAIPFSETVDVRGIPVVAIVGTTMSAGKTAAACSLVQAFTHAGLKVMAAKTTGVSLRRDILAMEDSGAKRVSIFTDLGIVTTTPDVSAKASRTLLTDLAADRPDVILLELGDGLLGLYGVDAILDDREIVKTFKAVVMAASDPVASWGGVKLLKERHGIDATVITGPATDNAAGIRLIEKQVGVAGINARSNPKELADYVMKHMGLSQASMKASQ